jgi:hypothetical protein
VALLFQPFDSRQTFKLHFSRQPIEPFQQWSGSVFVAVENNMGLG